MNKLGEYNQCKRCGEWYNHTHDCKQDYFSMYNYAKIHGIDLEKQKKSNLKIGDTVILTERATALYDGVQFNKEHYKEIHQNNIQGKVISINEIKDHYFWGEYAIIEWNNGTKSENIEVSWLKKYD